MTVVLEKQSDALEVQDIIQILKCGRKQGYELVNSGAFHVVRIGTKIKVSRRVFYEWYEGKEFTEWMETRKQSRG